MYTKTETYYMVMLRKSPKSYRANNYIAIPYEFISEKTAIDWVSKQYNCPGTDKYCEYVIIKCQTEPVKVITNTHYGQNYPYSESKNIL